jgi:hypothetical protein
MRMTIMPPGAFVVAVSIVAAATRAFQMMNLRAAAGASIMITEIIGSGVLIYMFLHPFNEPLSE